MSEWKFRPQIGMRTMDGYLHGAGNYNVIGVECVIEFVAKDYFVMRSLDDVVLLIEQDSYWVMQENDFI